jgi:hypothetical protein
MDVDLTRQAFLSSLVFGRYGKQLTQPSFFVPSSSSLISFPTLSLATQPLRLDIKVSESKIVQGKKEREREAFPSFSFWTESEAISRKKLVGLRVCVFSGK